MRVTQGVRNRLGHTNGARAKSSHDIVEQLVLPCAKEEAIFVFGEDVTRKFTNIFVSSDTVPKRINEILRNITEQAVVEKKGLLCSP